jgi:hypothetical protein
MQELRKYIKEKHPIRSKTTLSCITHTIPKILKIKFYNSLPIS